jgi:hypothetical protein
MWPFGVVEAIWAGIARPAFPPCPRGTSMETETIVFTQPGRQTLLLSGLSKHASERRSRRGHGVGLGFSVSFIPIL